MDPSLIIKTAEYEKSAVLAGQYPPAELPEIAFAGRSNVGKSSLINCLVQRKKLVKTSSTPGRTRTLNFFKINDAVYFVDLPGYGFAKVPESVRAAWKPMVERYLTSRKTLRGVVHILDGRHPPSVEDLNLWVWLQQSRIPSIPVLTKIDKLPRSKHRLRVASVAPVLGIAPDQLIVFSATTNLGRIELLQKIVSLLEA
jgi:GTP-binding protein